MGYGYVYAYNYQSRIRSLGSILKVSFDDKVRISADNKIKTYAISTANRIKVSFDDTVRVSSDNIIKQF